MRALTALLVAVWLFGLPATSEGGTVSVKPTEPLSALYEKLASDASVTEAVLAEGVYHGGLYVVGPKGTDFKKRPLLIRAAEGANVVFDGARPVEKFRPHEKLPGVFWIDYADRGGEYPKLWEPGSRVRYRLVADGQDLPGGLLEEDRPRRPARPDAEEEAQKDEEDQDGRDDLARQAETEVFSLHVPPKMTLRGKGLGRATGTA